MRCLHGVSCGLLVVWGGWVSCSVVRAQQADEAATAALAVADNLALGEAIFVHNWARPESWGRAESLGEGGDGLGPVFNAVSCVACHSMGGIGGAGGNERNVELLSVVFPPQARSLRRTRLMQRAKALHPQIGPHSLTVMLHQFGFGAGDETFDYDSWREGIVETALASEPSMACSSDSGSEDVQLRISGRNTPAVWGSGQIERLRRSVGDQLRIQISVSQLGANKGVSGRIPRTADGKPGWYGWRGHVEHLPEFVMSACANELGLSVSNHRQPASPRSEATRPAKGVDLTNAQVVALTRYVAERPRPEQVFPTDPADLEDVYAGEREFESAGCAVCHVPDLAFIKDLYSDLLLHDMGRSLADPVAAFPDLPPPPRLVRRRGGSYSGGSIALLPASPGSQPIRTRLTHEWRTPPLWGVADSPPYLHDGRAGTLDEAIRLHGGEAEGSVTAYRALTAGQRSQLLSFLGTLRAPQAETVVAAGHP